MNINYHHEQLRVADILSESKIIIPKFQRNIVWTKDRRIELINTLRKGEPFGILLLHKNEENKYILVDGLQRVSTIIDFCNDKFSYLTYLDIDYEKTEKLVRQDCISKGLPINPNYVKNKTESTLKKLIKIFSESISKPYLAIRKIREAEGFIDSEEIDDLIIDIISDFEETTKITSIPIHTIVYTGPKENLPNIFYNLNTGGVSLSKYEILASLWMDTKYIVDDENIIAKVKSKYQAVIDDSELEIDFDLNRIKREGINLFEYCYSISEILKSDTDLKSLLGKNKKSTDPIGFEILSLICGLDVNKSELIYDKLKNATPDFLIELKNMISVCFAFVQSSLSNLIIDLNGNNINLNNNYQIYHIVISYIRHNYEIDFNNYVIKRKSNKVWNQNFKKFVSSHYLYDGITNFWKINRQVGDLSRAISKEEILNKYVYGISKDKWQIALDEWMSTQSENISKTIPNINKLFLKYIFNQQVQLDKNIERYFKSTTGENVYVDIEHICPKNRMNDLGKIPISAVGNLCYLTCTDNRSKKDKTLYEHNDKRPAYITDTEFLNLIKYPEKSDLEFINYEKAAKEQEYQKFISDRQNELVNLFMDLL